MLAAPLSPPPSDSPAVAPTRPRALLVVEDARTEQALRDFLAETVEIVVCRHDPNALKAVGAVAVAIVDARHDAATTGDALRHSLRSTNLPIIWLTTGDDAALTERESAIDDVLVWPFGRRELLARLRVHLELARVRREAADRVLESEERFRHVADHSPLMFWVTEPDGRCSYLNQRWYEYTGQTSEKSLGSGWLDAIHLEDRPRVERQFSEARAGHAPFRVEYRLRRHDGAYRWMLDSAAPRFVHAEFAGYVGSILDVTDEREEREMLARERSQMQMALRAGRIGAFEWDIPSGRMLWSPELEILYGLKPGSQEQTFRAWAHRILPADLAQVEHMLQRCFEDRAAETEYEFRATLPDGTHRWLAAKARFTYAANGTPRRMVGVNMDIDDRKRTELNASFLNVLSQEVALLSDPHAILATAGRALGLHLNAFRCYFLTTDESAAHALVEIDWVRDAQQPSLSGRYPIASFGNQDLWRLVTTRTSAIEDVTRNEATRHTSSSYNALRIASWASAPFMRDGRWVSSLIVADDHVRPWRDDEVRLIETVLARVWPLVERARSEQAVTAAEAKIRESEERLRATVEAANLGTWDFNPVARSIIWNDRCKQLFGIPPHASSELDLALAAIHPADRSRVAQEGARTLTAGSDGRFEIEFRTRSPDTPPIERTLRASGRAYFADGAAVRMIGTVYDITEVAKARETLAERRAELERIVAERTAKLQETVAELEGFSYSISHDLRAPLRAMQSFAQLLAEECSPHVNEACRDYLRRIINASDRMDRLIHDVLVYSQVSRTELQLGPVNLEELIDGIIETYPVFDATGAEIVIRRPLPHVLGNEAALTQCVSNLLGNAVKFVARGTQPRVEIWAEVHAARVRLYVRDNGIGIAPEAHDKIFGIFERLSRNYDGTGIGLAVVRKAAERMGGSVSVQSRPGAGSTFCLELAYAL